MSQFQGLAIDWSQVFSRELNNKDTAEVLLVLTIAAHEKLFVKKPPAAMTYMQPKIEEYCRAWNRNHSVMVRLYQHQTKTIFNYQMKKKLQVKFHYQWLFVCLPKTCIACCIALGNDENDKELFLDNYPF